MPESKIPADKKSQLERFKEAAKEVNTDDREDRFDLVLKKVAKGSLASSRDDKEHGRK